MYSLFLKDSLVYQIIQQVYIEIQYIYIKEKELETYAPTRFIFFTFRAVKTSSR